MNLETLLEAAKFLDSVATSPTDVVPRETELLSDSNLLLGSSESSPFQGSISESSLYRSTSSSSVNTGSNSVALRRSGGAGTREVHNKLEKGRRAHLKECFVILKKHIPNAEERKTSNLSILRLALDHIETLKRNEKELQDLLEQEQTRYLMLQQSRANCRGFLENALPAVAHHASSPSTDTAEDSPIASESEFEMTNSGVNLCNTSASSSMMSSSKEPSLQNFIFGSQYIPTSSMSAAYLEQLRKQHAIIANFQPGSQIANPTSQSGSLFAGLTSTNPGLLSNVFGSQIVFNSAMGVVPPYDQPADRSAIMTNSYDQTYSNKSLSSGQGANSSLPAFALSPQFLSHYSAVSLASPSPQLGSAPVSFSNSSLAPVHTPLGINLTSPLDPVFLQRFLNDYSDQSIAFQSDILANNKTLPNASPHPASDMVPPVYPSTNLVPVSLPSNPMTVSYATGVGLVPASAVSSMAPASGDRRPIKPVAGQTDHPNLLLGSNTFLSIPQETVVKSGGLIMNTPLSGSSARQNRSAVQMRLQQTIAQRAKLHQQQKQVENAVCTETSVRFVTMTSAMHTSAHPSSLLDVKNLPTTAAMTKTSTNLTRMPSPRHLPIATSYLANNRLVKSNPNVMSNVMMLSDASAGSGTGVMAPVTNSSLNAAAASGSTPPLQFISQEMLLQLMRDQSSAGKQNLMPFPVSQSLAVNHPDAGSSNLGQLFVICPMSPSYQLGPLVTPVHVINSPFTSMGLTPDGPRPLLLDSSRGGVTPQQYSFATRPNNFTAFTRS